LYTRGWEAMKVSIEEGMEKTNFANVNVGGRADDIKF
jgi:hypothetical protein